MNNKLNKVLNEAALRSFAGRRSFLRGEDYFENGAVRHLYCDGKQVTADVRGTHLYHSRLTVLDGRLHGECDCPVGQSGDFCKHLVALGLAYLDSTIKIPESKSSFSWPHFLKTCDQKELIKIILEMSPNNPDVIEKYRMANLPSESGAKLRELKCKVDELFRLAEGLEEYYDDYYDSSKEEGEFISQKEVFEKVLNGLSAKDDTALLWDISTYAIEKFLKTSIPGNESIQIFVEDMLAFFLKVVRVGFKSDAEICDLFTEWESYGNDFGYTLLFDTLHQFPEPIKELWTQVALQKWKNYSQCVWGDYSRNDERTCIEHFLLDWADDHNNDSLKLEIMEKRLSAPWDVKDLMEEYRRQHMPEKIIPLLKRALKAFDGNAAIADWLADEQMKSGLSDDALKLAWKEFTNSYMSDQALKRLEKVSSRLKCWPEYYQKALVFLEDRDLHDSSNSHQYYYGIRQRRVEILFAHSDKEKAWDLAQDTKLSEEWWLKLAAWRSKDMPDKSAAVLKRLLDTALKPTGADAYRHVIKLLRLYRDYLKMANREAEFSACCADIRAQYKRRRLLMEQMNAAKM